MIKIIQDFEYAKRKERAVDITSFTEDNKLQNIQKKTLCH